MRAWPMFAAVCLIANRTEEHGVIRTGIAGLRDKSQHKFCDVMAGLSVPIVQGVPRAGWPSARARSRAEKIKKNRRLARRLLVIGVMTISQRLRASMTQTRGFADHALMIATHRAAFSGEMTVVLGER